MNTIGNLIEALKKSDDLSFEAMERILAENLPNKDEVIAAANVELPYGRAMLHMDERVEVIIGAWPKGGWCDVHDHGTAIGIVLAYGGEIEHFQYTFQDGCLDLTEHHTMRNGECVRLEQGMIHSLQNVSSDEPYIGLHIYSPPTSDVRVFDLKSGDIYHVTDDYPALIPDDAEKIINHEKSQFVFQNKVRAKLSQV